MKLKNNLIWSFITLNNTILWSSYKVHLSFLFLFYLTYMPLQSIISRTWCQFDLQTCVLKPQFSFTHSIPPFAPKFFCYKYLSLLHTSLWSRCIVVWVVLSQLLHSISEGNTTPCWELVLWWCKLCFILLLTLFLLLWSNTSLNYLSPEGMWGNHAFTLYFYKVAISISVYIGI